MKKCHLLFSLALLFSINAHSARVLGIGGKELSPGMLTKIQAIDGGEESIRVFLNSGMEVEYSDSFGEKHDIDDKRKMVTTEKADILRLKVSKLVKGAILDNEDNKRLFIRFSGDCKSRECAFQFDRDGSQYILSGVPKMMNENTGEAFSDARVFKKIAFVKAEMIDTEQGFVTKNGKPIKLIIDRKNLKEIDVKKKRLKGVE